MVEAFAFYLFAVILLVSALLVITARNPVHSVLFLILAFFNSSGLFILLGAEFIGLILVIVYVGAVAVLFLFVVMMLDISFEDMRAGASKYMPFGLVIGGVLLAEMAAVFGAWKFAPVVVLDTPAQQGVENTQALGSILYTDYILAFQISGLILLVAMIGAIVLTFRRRPGVRKQNVGEQFARRPEDVLKIVKVESGAGV